MRSNLDVIKKFADSGFSVNNPLDWDIEEWFGYTPLHFSITNKCFKTFKLLLDNDADLHVEDSEGFTPLQLAFNNGYTRIFNNSRVVHG